MAGPILRIGVRNVTLVRQWQTFLIGQRYYKGEATGSFDEQTDKATRAYQKAHFLKADGVVGNHTYGVAMTEGFELVPSETPEDVQHGPNWPPRPGLRTLGAAGRERVYGRIEYVSAPVSGNPEAIRVTNDWVERYLVTVTVPQLPPVQYAPKSGRIRVHALVAPKILELFQAWEDADLMHRVITWAGSYNARFIRGSRKSLSNHAYGSAFDINVPWNMLGTRPALVGEHGSVRELVPIANDLGWFWGGHYNGRKDGMHFELVKP